jgi:hypothetical protein
VGDYGDSDSDSDDGGGGEGEKGGGADPAAPMPSNLPVGFFDEQPSAAGPQPTAAAAKPASKGGATSNNLPAGFFDLPSEPSSDPAAMDTGTSATSNLPAGFFDVEPAAVAPAAEPVAAATSSRPGGGSLPAGFFDNEPATGAGARTGTGTAPRPAQSSSTAIPEGFFDDHVKDAKARKVEVRDAERDEMDRFEKEMEVEEHVSHQLRDERFEDFSTRRTLGDVEEQRCVWFC